MVAGVWFWGTVALFDAVIDDVAEVSSVFKLQRRWPCHEHDLDDKDCRKSGAFNTVRIATMMPVVPVLTSCVVVNICVVGLHEMRVTAALKELMQPLEDGKEPSSSRHNDTLRVKATGPSTNTTSATRATIGG